MLIDWFTVIAQIVNFLILVYLLKRFLYKPILDAIEEREKRIAGQLEGAAQQKAEAQEERQHYEQLNQELDNKKAALLEEAQSTAETERQRLIGDAKKEYADLRKKLEESLAAEKETLDGELKRRIQTEVFNIARKVLTDLADTSLESQLTNVFLQKLKALSKDEREQLRKAFSKAGKISVRSAFDLLAKQKQAIGQAVKKNLDTDIQIEFRTSPEEVGGIELAAGGFKVAWTIAEYLSTLQERIIGLTGENSGRPAASTSAKHGQ